MKVHLLEDFIQSFLTQQILSDDSAWFFPHSLVQRFHAQWKFLPEKGLKETYDECLRSDISSRWWKGDHYRPKDMMLEMIDADPELALIAWKDLQNLNASLEGRLSRFGYYCDQLLELHRAKHIDSIDSWHHQDASIISLYLAGLFPDVYTLYPGLDVFQNFCKAVGRPDIPKVDDLERYMKVAKIVFTFLQKNMDFEKLSLKRNAPGTKVSLIPLQVSYEVIVFAGTRERR
jgi:hypothetical protein